MSDRQPSVLLIDDGELEDVARALERAGADVERLSSEVDPARWPRPGDLLVVTARRATSCGPLTAWGAHQCTTIAVTDSPSKTLSSLLRRSGFDYLVRRPVHPDALRLLLMHALFKGRERRSQTRFPVGYRIGWRTAWWPRRAILAEISISGCRIIARREAEVGARVRVRLPHALTGQGALLLHGRVVRHSAQRGSSGVEVAIAFEGLETRCRDRLNALLDRLEFGPVRMPGAPEPVRLAQPGAGVAERAGTAAPAEAAAPAEPGEQPFVERRRHPRSALDGEVLALDAHAERVMRVLVGRDLSLEGIRVEPDPWLSLGKRCRVAIYDAASRDPIVLEAEVARNDWSLGVALRFVDRNPEIGLRLGQLMGKLPDVQSLQQGRDEPQGVVIGEILQPPPQPEAGRTSEQG